MSDLVNDPQREHSKYNVATPAAVNMSVVHSSTIILFLVIQPSEVNQHTSIATDNISKIFKKFRLIISEYILNEKDNWNTTIGGPGKIVEIDEAMISKRKYNRGKKKPDCWSGYNNIDEDGIYKHLTVNHSHYFKDPVTGAYTNSIEENV
ncbi:uncharacterized protein BYT42DRAFT_545377 [Radiomyces spectabilis]|uniref:uncharacterized protein n=1 Tax=Radiomyces spectabilis TaxID=64574 RepID=UPI00221EF0AC|nr:uncharacterized protein BYT42DRAFT_545377 [Radiomyces spectabilis]KAI8381498.1 hypothetical protein BYT42DRAFT_545377 [Radiomyces spectabilis]